MSEIQLLSLTCKDRTKESGPYGGYTTWEFLMEAMERQKKLPVEKRIRPCLKDQQYYDWWIEQVPWCQKCEKATWHLSIDGEKRLAKSISIKGKIVELAVAATGEILICTLGKRHEPVKIENPAEAGLLA